MRLGENDGVCSSQSCIHLRAFWSMKALWRARKSSCAGVVFREREAETALGFRSERSRTLPARRCCTPPLLLLLRLAHQLSRRVDDFLRPSSQLGLGSWPLADVLRKLRLNAIEPCKVANSTGAGGGVKENAIYSTSRTSTSSPHLFGHRSLQVLPDCARRGLTSDCDVAIETSSDQASACFDEAKNESLYELASRYQTEFLVLSDGWKVHCKISCWRMRCASSCCCLFRSLRCSSAISKSLL